MVSQKLRHRSPIEEPHSASANDEADDCPRSHATMPKLAHRVRNSGEGLAMTILRFILAGQLHGDGACYEAAYQAAEAALDLPEAVELVARVTCLVLAIRRERNDVFHFLPAPCCRITHDEQEFLTSLQAAIDNDHASFSSSLFLLLRSQAGRCTGQALSLLAQALVHSRLAFQARRRLQ